MTENQDMIDLICEAVDAHTQGDGVRALHLYTKALAYKPPIAPFYNNFGSLYLSQKAYSSAYPLFLQAIALDGEYSDAYYNLALTAKGLGDLSQALALYNHALQLDPDNPAIHYNLAFAYDDSGDKGAAEHHYKTALALNPSYANAGWNLSLLYLSQGRYNEGWPLYEWRHHPCKDPRRILPPQTLRPMWQGESLKGKRLVVYSEQGFGDDIHFIRYLTPLKDSGATIFFVSKKPLIPLFETMPCIDRIFSFDDELNDEMFDLWCFVMSLPSHISTIPTTMPYLFPPSDQHTQWSKRLDFPNDKLKIGLVWRGNPYNSYDSDRSLTSLDLLAPLFEIDHCRWYSLQKGEAVAQIAYWQDRIEIFDSSAYLDDFGVTAGLIAHLDLVISVDTAVAHVAAALGIPCWILLSCDNTDWRWQNVGEETIWYPTVKLYRQQKSGEWDAPIQKIKTDLLHFRQGVFHATLTRPFVRSFPID